MDPHQPLSFTQLFTHLITEIARAAAVRPHQTEARLRFRTQIIAQMILGLAPRDVLEVMLAGQTVMLHGVLTDSIRDMLEGEMDTLRRGTRANIVALNRAFMTNLDRLESCQRRPSQGTRLASGAPAADLAGKHDGAISGATPDAATMAPGAATADAPVARPAATVDAPMEAPAATDELTFLGGHKLDFTPMPETVALCRANKAAMAALDAGDPVAFARALGVPVPSEAYALASTPMFATLAKPSGAAKPSGPAVKPNRRQRRHPR